MRKTILLIVAALSMAGCASTLVASGDSAAPDPMDVFVFQERCIQESQGDG